MAMRLSNPGHCNLPTFLLRRGGSGNVCLAPADSLGCQARLCLRNCNLLAVTAKVDCCLSLLITLGLGVTKELWRHFYHNAAIVNVSRKRAESTFVAALYNGLVANDDQAPLCPCKCDVEAATIINMTESAV